MLLMAVKTVIVAIKNKKISHISNVFNMRSKTHANEILFSFSSPLPPNITESATFLFFF